MQILYRLTVGPAVGAIRELFTKVKAIDAKHGKFDLVICVGDFFGPPDGENVSQEVGSDLRILLTNSALARIFPKLLMSFTIFMNLVYISVIDSKCPF